MTSRELTIVGNPDTGLVLRDWTIDQEEIRGKIFSLVDLLEGKLKPIREQFKRVQDGSWNRYRRAELEEEFHAILRDELGVVSPEEANLEVGQPFLLIWRSSIGGTMGDEEMPIFIQIGRVVRLTINQQSDMEADVISLCEVPKSLPEVRRIYFQTDYQNTVTRREIYGNSPVIVPLTRKI